MKNITAALLILLLAVAGVSASAQNDPARKNEYPGAWMQISGAKSGINNFETVFVESQKDLEKLWKRHSEKLGEQAKTIPVVNFEEERLVAVFLGERYTEGYRVGLTVIAFPDKPDQLYVIYKEIKPESGRMHAQVMVQPFVLRKVSKKFKVAHFEADRQYSYPELDAKPETAGKSGEYHILPIGSFPEIVEGESGEYRILPIGSAPGAGEIEPGELHILPIGNVLERIEKVEGEVEVYRTLLEGRGL